VLEAAFDLSVGLALGSAAFGVGAGAFVALQAAGDHGVQGPVELAVAGAVEPVAHGLARRRRDRGGAREHGEGGVVAAAAGVGPGGEHGGGHDRADAGRLEQVRSPGAHDGADGLLVVERFGLQEASAASEVTQHGQGGDDLGVAAAGARAQPGGGGDHGASGLPAEPGAHLLRSGDHQRRQLPLAGGGALHGGPAGGQEHLQRGPLSSGLGLSQPGAGQHAAGAGVDDRGGVGLAVGVDADDDFDQLCRHGHAFFSLTGGRSRSRSGAEMAGP
jgi:hypothetical protein